MAQERHIWQRTLFALLLAIVPGLAHAEVTRLVCTNPSSGATWDVKVDFDHRTADSFPADIDDRYITWKDTQHNDIYEFDRVSGDLTMRGPTSLGGYFLYDHCQAQK